MAIGVQTDFEIFEDEFYGGMNETLRQNTDAFNAASQGAIRLTPEGSIGNFQKEAFFQQISGLVRRRDPDSTSSDTDDKLTSDLQNKPKVYRKIQAAQTVNSLANIMSDPQEFSFLLGQQIGKAKSVDYLNTLMLIANTALQQTTSGGPTGSGAYFDATGESTSTLTTDHLITGLSRMGDAGEDVVAWVTHSVPFYDLMSDQKGIEIDSVAGQTIVQGTVSTLGRPVIVTDSTDLKNSGAVSSSSDIFQVLGLTENAVAALESQADDQMVEDVVTGNENIVFRLQGEHAYNVAVKGYDYTNSTKNPDDSSLGSTGNWSSIATETVKDGPGVLIEVTG